MLSLLDLDTPADVVRAFTDLAVPGAFRQITAMSQADRDPTKVSISGFGGCTAFVAHALHGTAPTWDPRQHPQENRQANLGSMQHAGLLPYLADQFAGETLVEHPVSLSLLDEIYLKGTLDLYVPGAIIDLKTTGEFRLQTVRRQGGPFKTHRMQVMLYAWAMAKAGYPVRWVIWLYMDRASGQQTVIVDSLSDAMVELILDRAHEVLDYADEPEYAPIEERGPGTLICDSCPFLHQCFGADARPGVRPTAGGTIRNNAEVERVLADLTEAQERKRRAEEDIERGQAFLMRSLPGRYGRFEWHWQGGSERTDTAQVKRDYVAGVTAGTKPPTFTTNAFMRVKILDGAPV